MSPIHIPLNIAMLPVGVKIAWINSLSGISGLHSYQILARNLCDELVIMMISNIAFAFKIFRQTTVLKNGMSRVQRQCLLLLLLMISVTHSTCGVLCSVSWRGVRGCLNNVSGCYCKI